MRITNNLKIPVAIVRALENSDYEGPSISDPKVLSVTRLIAPTQQVALLREYDRELEQDASQMVFALLGQGVHAIIARAEDEHGLYEQRFTSPCNGWTISGQVDHYEAGVITDYKVTTVWNWQAGASQSWMEQLNVYAWLMKTAGYPVHKLQIACILRDYKESGKRFCKPGDPWPPHAMPILEVPLWGLDTAIAYVEERVEAHQKAAAGQPQECSAEERWERNGKSIRCAKYCAARPVCAQARKEFGA